jgi:CBS domain-containing protein
MPRLQAPVRPGFAFAGVAEGDDQELIPTKGRMIMGTKVAEVMTTRPRAVTPQTSVREAAQLMEEEDVGALPVVEEEARLVGIVTDRDVAVRVVSRGLDP